MGWERGQGLMRGQNMDSIPTECGNHCGRAKVRGVGVGGGEDGVGQPSLGRRDVSK